MDDDQKKIVKIVVVIVCMILAAVLSFTLGNFGGGKKGAETDMRYLVCEDPDCGGSTGYDMEQWRALLGTLENPRVSMHTAFTCDKCGEDSAYQGLKCQKCETVFLRDTENSFQDKCPGCGHSESEERLKKRDKE